MKYSSTTAVMFGTLLTFLLCVQTTHAGMWDNLRSAAQKVQQTTNDVQNIKNTGTQIKNTLPKTQDKNTTPESEEPAAVPEHNQEQTLATDDKPDCLSSIKAYRWKLMGDTLQKKLFQEQNLDDVTRQEWEEDIFSLKEAYMKKLTMINQPDPANPDRYLPKLSSEELKEINLQFGKHYNQEKEKCGIK